MHYIAICSADLPFLIPPFIIKECDITKSTLLLHDGTRQYAEWYKQFVDKINIPHFEVVLSEYKYDKIIKTLSRIVEQIDEDEEVLFNTYGVQPMLLDAITECTVTRKNIKLCYIDIEDNKFVFLDSKETKLLPSCLRVLDILACQGYSAVSHDDHLKDPRPEYYTACKKIIKNFKDVYKGIAKLNYYASSAKNSLTIHCSPPISSQPHVFKLVSILQDYNLASCTDTQIKFANEEARFFANGGWLEQYVHTVLHKLYQEKLVTDYAMNLEILSSINVRNELDAAFTAKNRLFVIECKTIRWQTSSDRSHPVYKLKSIITDIGGAQAKGILVSAFDVDQMRCEEYEMRSIQQANIINLEENIRMWINDA